MNSDSMNSDSVGDISAMSKKLHACATLQGSTHGHYCAVELWDMAQLGTGLRCKVRYGCTSTDVKQLPKVPSAPCF